ncbi:MAG: alginate export family protein, partial [Aquisalinus sp.]|nr:alginate export family protein [Aquisalinus sp.]
MTCRAYFYVAVALLSVGCPALQASEPWRLEEVLKTPDWLSVSGNARIRYETLDGQFRAANGGTSDQLLALRTLIHARASFDKVTFGAELQDARTYLDDDGTPLSTSFTNAGEALQAYTDLHLDHLLGWQKETDLKLGRFTLDVGSRRAVERNSFRNTINNYDGAHLRMRLSDETRLEVFYVSPVRKQPRDRHALDDNEISGDETESNRQFWGVHVQRQDLWPDVTGEVFAYGLHEEDTARRQTPDREVYWPGVRIFRKPSSQQLDFEVEAATRFGTRRATSDSADTTQLNVDAQMLHAEIGYTFEGDWMPRLNFEYDLATGDSDQNDQSFTNWERFFGTRRGDLGNTSIHGPLTRSNLSAPGARFSFDNRQKGLDGRIVYQAAY